MKEDDYAPILYALKNTPRFSDLDLDSLAQELSSVHPDGFSTKIGHAREQTLNDSQDSYRYFLARRVLDNENAYQQEALIRGVCLSTLSFGKVYSSRCHTWDIRATPLFLDEMSSSKAPYSLLGKIEQIDIIGENRDLFVRTYPVLIIPGISESIEKEMTEWEKERSSYEEEAGVLFFRGRCPISREHYEKRV